MQEGDIVVFAGYKADLPTDATEILEIGEHVKIIKVEESTKGDFLYNVRPILDGGELDYERPSEQIYQDEIEEKDEPATKPAQKAKKDTASKANENTEPATEPVMQDHDPAVTTLIRSTNDIAALAYSLYEEHEELYYKLGGVLCDIKSGTLHVVGGYEDTSAGFFEYVEDHIGPAQRTAYYLMATYKRLRQADITANDLQGIGWTKARLIKNIKDPEQIKEFIEKAKNMTRGQLEQEVENMKENGARPKKSRFNFVVEQDVGNLVNQALDYAMEELKTDSKNMALEKICTFYLLTEVGVRSVQNDEDLMEGARD